MMASVQCKLASRLPIFQVKSPLTARLPGPVNVPPSKSSVLLIEDVVANESEPAETTIAALLVRLWTKSIADVPWSTVMPLVLMTAASADPGTMPELQLLAVSQSPEPPTQVTVEGRVRSS